MFDGQDYERVSEDADYDGGDAVEQVSGVTHNERESFAAEFGEVDAGEQADGQAHHCGEKQQLEAADDSVSHAAAGFADGFRKLSKEIQAERRAAVPDQVAEDKK